MSDEWLVHSQYVLKKLESLEKKVDSISDKLNINDKAISILNVKAGVWGVLGGAIPVIVGIGIWFLRSSIK